MEQVKTKRKCWKGHKKEAKEATGMRAGPSQLRSGTLLHFRDSGSLHLDSVWRGQGSSVVNLAATTPCEGWGTSEGLVGQ